jgi:hypothetical protein
MQILIHKCFPKDTIYVALCLWIMNMLYISGKCEVIYRKTESCSCISVTCFSSVSIDTN